MKNQTKYQLRVLEDGERTELFQRFLCAALSACPYSIGKPEESTRLAFASAHAMLAKYEEDAANGRCP